MSAGAEEAADEPGPPPLPPRDLRKRLLPIHRVPAGTQLYRIHPADRLPIFFGPQVGEPPRNRWDAPGGEFGVCYLAEQPWTAFAETFLRVPERMTVEEVDLETRSVARVLAMRELRLAALHGHGLRRLGATAAVCSGPYSVSRAWSLALHGHPEKPDGIRYRARHDDDGFAIALFDRASRAVAPRDTAALTHPALEPHLGAWLDRYSVGLV